jgi:hypothetical protein
MPKVGQADASRANAGQVPVETVITDEDIPEETTSAQPVNLKANNPKPVVPFPQERSPWVRNTVRLPNKDDKGSWKKEGLVYGAFVVFPCCSEGYGIRHIRTGCTLEDMCLPDAEDLLLIGEYLFENFCSVFSKSDRDELLAVCPKWIVYWIRKCKENKGLVDPEPFEQDPQWHNAVCKPQAEEE